MESRSPEVLLDGEVRCAVDDFIRDAQSKDPLCTLISALDKWLSIQRPGTQRMLAVALASKLLTQTATQTSKRPDLLESGASPDEVLTRWRKSWEKKYHLPLQQGEQKCEEPHKQELDDVLMRRFSADEMRRMISSLRLWLRSWLAECTCEVHTTPSLTPSS